ncbi:MAG: CotH kinase family protein [Clostridia bacterium]|nr:CotH kinase family protein [Clostridia bacterium]
MKKRILFICLLSVVLLLCACVGGEAGTESDVHTEQGMRFSIKYIAEVGGYIDGIAEQSSDESFISKIVTAVPNKGYRFVGWSDGSAQKERADLVNGETTVYARFAKVHNVKFVYNEMCGLITGDTEQEVLDNTPTQLVTALPRIGYEFSHWSTGEKSSSIVITTTEDIEIEAIFKKSELSLPILSVNTVNGAEITSKNEYLGCFVSASGESAEHTFNNASAKIRGRGNTTWDYDKKPYRLKFNGEVDLFGMGEAKDYILLANHSDLSMSRNYLAQSVASLFESINQTSSCQFVDLYLNGEYRGVYLVCEQIEFDKNRIEVTGNETLDTSYLIEMDGHVNGDFTVGSDHYTLKVPNKDEVESFDEYEAFIYSYLCEALSAAKGDDYSLVCELIDVRSFAEAYIVYELFNCVDAGYSSFNIYKEAGGKLYCGPVWDFDRSVGIVGHHHDAKPYTALWARWENDWFNALLSHEEFYALVGEILSKRQGEIGEKLNFCYDYLYKSRDSFDRNFTKWRILGTFVWPNDDELTALDTWDLQVEYTRSYLFNSLDYLLEIYKTE